MNIEDLLGYARRTGMFWPSAEIYGGSAGLYDYGHIGAMLKRRFENVWLSYFVERNQNYFLIDGTTILPEKPLVASGLILCIYSCLSKNNAQDHNKVIPGVYHIL